MIVYNVTCNVAPEVEKQWQEWIDLQLNDISNPKNKHDLHSKAQYQHPNRRDSLCLQYQITDQNTLENFLKNEDQTLKDRIKRDFGEAVLHFSQLKS